MTQPVDMYIVKNIQKRARIVFLPFLIYSLTIFFENIMLLILSKRLTI